jgi:hypothetical protein
MKAPQKAKIGVRILVEILLWGNEYDKLFQIRESAYTMFCSLPGAGVEKLLKRHSESPHML